MDMESGFPATGSVATAFSAGARRAIVDRAFLLAVRRRAFFDPELDLRRFLSLEDKIDAIGESMPRDEATEREAESLLDDGDPWMAASAAWAWLETGRVGFDDVCRRVARIAEHRQGPWREALRRVRRSSLTRLFPEDRIPVHESARAMIVDARVWAGGSPGPGADDLAQAEQPWARATYARSLGFAPRLGRDQARALVALIEDPEPPVSRRALWSAALHDPIRAVERARAEIRGGSVDPFHARLVGLLGDRIDVDLLLPLLAIPETRRAAIRALGELGDARMTEPLLRFLDSADGEIRRAALDAYETLAGRIPRHPGSLPCAATARAHWEGVRARAGTAERLLRGRPAPSVRPPAMGSSMEVHWRAALREPSQAPRWLRREVPSGLFEGDSADPSPGE